ncbi:MAG TPA: hypothetical protein VFI78_05805, partial [Salinimicrobium sp.]|nr:hypothetical protein [Salinimicrobium sp.]
RGITYHFIYGIVYHIDSNLWIFISILFIKIRFGTSIMALRQKCGQNIAANLEILFSSNIVKINEALIGKYGT